MAQTWDAWWGLSLVRTILGLIDWVFFQILGCVYEVFYAVANAELFSGETVYNFIGRIQLILGVFMVFKLTIMILKAMVNPDTLNDKAFGASQLITRIVTSLVMLSLIMPLNIPNPKNRFEVEVNNNGIMFGTLYSLQKRVLENDVLGQLILGNDAPRRASDGSVVSSRMPSIKDKFISTIAKGFVQRNHKEEGSDEYMCSDSDIVKDNNYENATVTGLFLDHINDDCGFKIDLVVVGVGSKKYALAYIPIVGGIVAIIFTVLFAVFSIDIAIRAVKLSVLRLIAPIPIISYMEPGQEKNGAFANWTKMLIATYLDLFIRLAMVYFALFLIDDIIKNGLIMNGSMGVSGLTGVVAFIVICIGLLMFAKMAPKFITDALGIKSHLSNVGLSALLGGTAMAMGGGGLSGFGYGAMNGMKASLDGEAAGKPVPLGDQWSKNRDLMAKIRTGDKDAQGGFFGKAQDYMNYKIRDDEASKLGYSRENLALANWNKKDLGGKLQAAENAYDDAVRDLEHFENTADKNSPIYQQQYADKVANIQKLRAEKQDLADKAEKAAKSAKTIEDRRTQLGAGPRIYDDVLYKTDASGDPTKARDQYRDNYTVKDDPQKNAAGLPTNVPGNFTTDSNAVDPFKGQGGKTTTGGNTNVVDDSALSGSYGTGAGTGPGPR